MEEAERGKEKVEEKKRNEKKRDDVGVLSSATLCWLRKDMREE